MKPFKPLRRATVTCTAATASARQKLGAQPISGEFQVRVRNTGAVTAYICFGSSADVAAELTDTPLGAGATEIFTVENRDSDGAWYIAGITETSTAELQATTGRGAAGGGGGGGSGSTDVSALALETTAVLAKNALITIRDSTATASVAQDTATVRNGATSLTPKFAVISAALLGDNTLVAAVATKKIRVLAYNLMGAGAVNARFQTAVAGAYLTGLKYIAAAGGGICAPFNPVGWFETVAGDLLNLELSGAVAVGGEIVYIEV